jgi:hypothetical protein
MLTVNWKLGLLTLIVVPVMIAGAFIWQKYARVAFIRVRRAIAIVELTIAGRHVRRTRYPSLSREKRIWSFR